MDDDWLPAAAVAGADPFAHLARLAGLGDAAHPLPVRGDAAGWSWTRPARDADLDGDMDDLADMDDTIEGDGDWAVEGMGDEDRDEAGDTAMLDNEVVASLESALADSANADPAAQQGEDSGLAGRDATSPIPSGASATTGPALLALPLPTKPGRPDLPFEAHFHLASLPYATSTEFRAEPARHIRRIYAELAAAAADGDVATGVIYWTRRLHAYLDTKFPLALDDRVAFVRFYYELIITPDMDMSLIEAWANMATRLLKKKELLKPAADTLRFEWRPLADLIVTVRRKSLPPVPTTFWQQLLALGRFLDLASPYFDASAADEVMREYIPKISLFEMQYLAPPLVMINFFVPTRHATRAHVDSLLGIWRQVVHCPPVNTVIMEWLVRVVQDHPWATHADWWRPAHDLPELYAIGMRMLDLPVGSSDTGGTTVRAGGSSTLNLPPKFELSESVVMKLFQRKRLYTRMRVLAAWIVATIDFPGAMDHLTSLIRAVEPFAHPSNRGAWTPNLSKLIHALASRFIRRISDNDNPPSDTLRALTRPFVELLRGPVFQLLHARDNKAASTAQGAIRYLATLDASSIMPTLLQEHVYPALGGDYPGAGIAGMAAAAAAADAGVHAHRTLTAIVAARASVWALTHPTLWPPGPRDHLLELLFLVLPGIDVNDHNKTLATLLFLSDAFSVFRFDNDARFPGAAAFAEDWIAQFLAKVFALLENIDAAGPDATQSGQSSAAAAKGRGPTGIEGNMVQSLVYTCTIVFAQLPADLHGMAARKFTNWVQSRTFAQASDAVSRLVANVVSRDPAAHLPRWLEWLDERVADEVHHGAGSRATVHSSSVSEGTGPLLWYQTLLKSLAAVSGTAILATAPLWERIVARLDPLPNRASFRHTHRITQRLIAGLTGVYPADYNNTDWESETAAAGSTGGDALFPAPGDVAYRWHIPSDDEVKLATTWLTTALDRVGAQIRALVAAAQAAATAAPPRPEDAMDQNGEPRAKSPTVGQRKAGVIAHFDAFDVQHAWIKAMSELNHLVAATTGWTWDSEVADAPRPRPVYTIGPQCNATAARATIVELLMAAWSVLKYAGDAAPSIQLSAEVRHATTAGGVAPAAAAEAAGEAKPPASAAAASGSSAPNVNILAMLVQTTRGFLVSGRTAGNLRHTAHALSVRKSLARLPLGIGAGAAWDESDPDAGRQIGPAYTTAKLAPRSVHVLRAHTLHLRRVKAVAQRKPWGNAENALVAYLYPHALSTYSGVRNAVQGTLVSAGLSSGHPALRREIMDRVLAATTALPFATGLDKDERAARLRSALAFFRHASILRTLTSNPQYYWPFARTVLTVAMHQDQPHLVDSFRTAMLMFIAFVSAVPFTPTPAPKARAVAEEVGWTRFSVVRKETAAPAAGGDAMAVDGAAAKEEYVPPTPDEKRALLQDALHKILAVYLTDGASLRAETEDAGAAAAATPAPDAAPSGPMTMTKLHWRVSTAVLFLTSALMVRADLDMTPDLVRVITRSMIHPHPNMRAMGEALLQNVQSWLKSKAGKTPARVELAVDDQLREYLRNERAVPGAMPPPPAGTAAAEHLFHFHSTGWLCFPEKITAYRIGDPAGPRYRAEDELVAAEIRAAFADPQWVERFFHFHTLELATRPGQQVNISWNFANQLRHLVMVLGPAVVVDAVLPTAVALLQSPHDKSFKLKCGLEWAAALLRGSKHWAQDDRDRVYATFVPHWTAAMTAAGPDTYYMFYHALRFVLGNRDPRQTQPLVDAVIRLGRAVVARHTASTPPATPDVPIPAGTPAVAAAAATASSSASAFGDAKRLVYYRALVEAYGPRSPADAEEWVHSIMLPVLNHPFKLARDTLSLLLSQSMLAVHRLMLRDYDAWIVEATATREHGWGEGDGSAVVDASLDPICRVTEGVVAAVARANAEPRVPGTAPSAAKSAVVLALSVINSFRGAVAQCVLPSLVPVALRLVPSDDAEAAGLAAHVVGLAAQIELVSRDEVFRIIDTLVAYVRAPPAAADRPVSPVGPSDMDVDSPASPVATTTAGTSWQIRLKVLRYIQVVYFRHLFLLSPADRAAVLDTVFTFLPDPHVEVRALAGVTVAGLLQCTGGIRGPDAARVRAHAAQLLTQYRVLPKRRPGQPLPAGYADAVRMRHAGVLALAAVVRAHPYDVPEGMPEILVKLAAYAEDPVPIGTGVRGIFADFKRTHADTWHVDAMMFDADQRSVLADMLVSPSYYA
ncbi:Proteasome activator BLM10 [Blastocladiella emersonii ATCC 22665]|nr:Proteasome activator BLM10 [Blastocladiella emersonii ATCC 22665]